tara:strand:- start:1209 stop:1604 length:396 start_codon:yes stop_codon:yes gene_type:complete
MDKTTLETHDYDTRLTKVLKTKKEISEEEFKIFIKCLKEINNFLNQDKFLKVNSKINAQKTLHLLANDRRNNYDDKNKIHTELLIPIIWDKVKKYNELTIYDIFVEQLNDIIISGPCSQGRTTRLIQLLSI